MLVKLTQFKDRFAPVGSFRANVLTLMTGTAVSQVLMIVISPLLAHFFLPEDFGIYGIYMGILGIAGSIVCLNYEFAIVLPKEEEEAMSLVAISLSSCILVSFLTFVVLLFVPLKLIYPANPHAISNWVWVLPISVLAFGISGTLEAWCTRKKLFKESSWAKMIRAGTTALSQLLGGFKKIGSLGLIFGAVLGDFISSMAMLFIVPSDDFKNYLSSRPWKNMAMVAKKYIDFPLYSSSQNLMNAISISTPAFFLTYFYGAKIAGFYLLGIKLIQVPAELVSRSFRQVFYQKAAEVHNEEGDLFVSFKSSTLNLMKIAIVPSLIIFFFAPWIFKVFLGANWETAGEFSRWLVLWIYLNFANVPAICCYRILKLQPQLFKIYFFYLLFRVLSLWLGGLFFSAYVSVMLFALVGVIFNAIIIVFIWRRFRDRLIPAAPG